MSMKTLSDLMTRKIRSVSRHETVIGTAAIMAEVKISSVLVVDNDEALGIVTELDVLRFWSQANAADCAVGEIMSFPLMSAPCDMDWKEAYHRMVQQNIRHLVVTGANGEIVGIVSETDFRRKLGLDFLSRVHNLSTVMSTEALLLPLTASLEQATQVIMDSGQATCVVVVEDGLPVGVLTERDATRLFACRTDIRATPVSKVMSSPPVTIDVNASLPEAVDVMLRKGLRHLVVVRDGGMVAGVLSEHNIVSLLESEYLDDLRDRNETVSAALHVSETKLHAVFDQVGVFLSFLAPDGSMIKANTATLKAAGISIDAVVGQPVWLMPWWTHDPKQLEKLRLAIEHAALSGITTRFDATHRIGDGTVIFVDFTLRPIFSREGQLAYLLAEAHDVTQRRKAEEAVRSSQQHFEALVSTTPVGVFETDAAGKCIYVNQRALELTGLSRQQAVGDGWVNAIHPDDRKEVDEFRNVIGRDRHSSQFELRLILPDGSLRWVLGQAAVLQSVEGQVAGSILTITDITQMKLLEEQLLLASAVFEASSEAILVTDVNNRIVAVNPGFTRITGYEKHEVIGHLPSLLSSGRHEPLFYKAMWDKLNSTGHWEGELWNRRKDGQTFVEWASINTIRDKAGKAHWRFALFSDVTEKKKTEELVWKQANYDILTGLPNRRLFCDRLYQELKRAKRTRRWVALLFIDLDRFKDINDTLGHNFGDKLLVEAANRISKCVREADTVARLGGDEFTIILSNLLDLARVEQVAKAINKALAEPFELGSETLYLSCSIGITIFPTDASDVETLLKNADQAMYVAKECGRNRFCYFTETMQVAAQKKLQLSNDLRSALADRQLEVYYQPIVNLSSGRIEKAEALLRWQHPTHGDINPTQFIAIAEESGLINEIGEWVFKESALFAKRWSDVPSSLPPGSTRQLGLDNDEHQVQISVNKSPRQFLGGNTHQSWVHYLSEIDLPTTCISIEITEGLLLEDRPEVAEKLRQFRQLGIQVTLDDFGTGYSSMSYLKKFEIDYLKIDRSFVQDMEVNPNSRSIAEAIIAMAHKLGIKVIAEGVETTAQREILSTAGCDYAQGHLFSMALPQEKFVRMICPGARAAHC